MEYIGRSGLPRSGYIVSLILWTLKSGISGDVINEAVLLENIIDYILQKMDYKGALRSDFDFTSKVAVLQELSVYFRSATASVTKNDVVTHVIAYLNRKGLKYDGGEIVTSFIDCGLFVEIDDTVEFRYRRLEEYFTAGYLRDNRQAFDAVTNAANWNGYAREMDLYTSRYRNEADLLKIAREKVDSISMPTPKLDELALKDYLADGGNFTQAAKRLKKMRNEPMSARKIDELRDKADASVTRRRSSLAKRKVSTEQTVSNVRAFNLALEVYTNFVRNLEFADSTEKVVHLKHCFDLWELHSSLLLSGLNDVFVEIQEDLLTDPEVPDRVRGDIVQISKDIEKQVKFLLPQMISNSLYHKIGTEKLAHLIHDIAEDKTNSPLQRLIASFVLMDIDAAKSMELMSSSAWLNSMGDDWISSMIERKLHQYYLEQHLTGELRRKFETFVATLETRVSSSKRLSDARKGMTIQHLGKSLLLADMKERSKKN